MLRINFDLLPSNSVFQLEDQFLLFSNLLHQAVYRLRLGDIQCGQEASNCAPSLPCLMVRKGIAQKIQFFHETTHVLQMMVRAKRFGFFLPRTKDFI